MRCWCSLVVCILVCIWSDDLGYCSDDAASKHRCPERSAWAFRACCASMVRIIQTV